MLEIKNISVSLGKTIIENISFKVNKGDFLLIIGPNGSGKTTLLKTIAGIYRYSGKILFNKTDIGSLKKKSLARLISYQPQRSDFSLPIKVKDILVSGRFPYSRLFYNYKITDIRILNRISERFKLSELLNRDINTLSGGERKRVLIASAYIQDVSIFLFDEPLSSLDPKETINIVNMLNELHRDGKTVIVVTHRFSLLFGTATGIVSLKKGKLSYSGSKEGISRAIPEIFDMDFETLDYPGGKIFVPKETN